MRLVPRVGTWPDPAAWRSDWETSARETSARKTTAWEKGGG